MRINQFIAHAGICSRRKAEDLVISGRVTLNGEPVTELSTRVNPDSDDVRVDGQRVETESDLVYFMLWKPQRVVCSADDEKGRENVVDLIDTPMRIYPVGRLDFLTTGLILLTNDGELTHRLSHPSFEIDKSYRVIVRPPLRSADIQKLAAGIEIGDGETTHPCDISIVHQSLEKMTLSITLHEGRNRQIRRMMEAVDRSVEQLHRFAYGPLTLNGLNYGSYRPLNRLEINSLKQMVNLV